MKKATKRAVVILIGILCLAVAIWTVPKLYRVYQTALREEELRQANIEYPFLDRIVIKRYRGKDYYVAKKPYEGEYDTQSLMYERLSKEELEAYEAEGKLGEIDPGAEERRLEWHKLASGENETREDNERPLEEAEVLQVMDYEEYVDYCKEWRLFQKYSDPDMKYIVRGLYTETYARISSLSGVGYEDSTAVLYFVEESSSMFETGVTIYIIPTHQDVDTVEIVRVYDDYQYGNILQYGQPQNPSVE